MGSSRYIINIGSNIFLNTPCAIGYKKEDGIAPFLQAKIRQSDNSLQFSFDAFDKNGNKFHVRNNKPVGTNEYKIEVIHRPNQKIVRDKLTGKNILDIRNLNDIEIYGDFYFNNTRIQSNENALIIRGIKLSDNEFENCGGILLDKNGILFGFNGEIPDLKNINKITVEKNKKNSVAKK